MLQKLFFSLDPHADPFTVKQIWIELNCWFRIWNEVNLDPQPLKRITKISLYKNFSLNVNLHLKI
jgi:hypothetical protein